VAKEFLKHFIQPKVIGEFVELGLGPLAAGHAPRSPRGPFWQDPKDPHLRGYVQQGLLGPTLPELLRVQPGDGGGALPARVEPGHDRRGEGGG